MADRSMGFDVFAKAHGEALIKLSEDLERLGDNVDRLNRKRAVVEAEARTEEAERKLGRFANDVHRRISAAVESLPDVELSADASDVDRALADVRRRLQELSDKRIGIDIDDAEAQRQVRSLHGELERLNRLTVSPRVKADTAAAMAELHRVSGEARRVNGQPVHVTARVDGDRALSVLGLIVTGLGAVGLAAGPAVAALAAVGAAGGAALSGLGTAAVGFSGIGDAVSDLQAADQKAAGSGASMASARQSQANGIAAAHRAMQQAQQSADRSAITGGWQVADARRTVGDAITSAARAERQAETDLAGQQRESRRAQDDLTAARAEAVTELRDMRLGVQGAALDERTAVLDLKDARAALAEGMAQGVEGDDLERLRIAAGRAALGLEQTRNRVADLGKEQGAWARQGLAASDTVRSAQDRYAGSLEGVRAAQRSLTETQSDGDKQVADAQRGLQRTILQTGWQQQDSAAQVADAQRQMAQAMESTAATGGGAAAELKKNYDQLGPAGQSFADFLNSSMVPALHRVRDGVQASMLPKVQEAMSGLLDIEPLVTRELAATGDVLGDLAKQGSAMVTSGPWRADFATIMAANRTQLRNYGHAGLDTADAFRSIIVAAEPLAIRLSDAAERGADLFNSWIQGKRASGELERTLNELGDEAVDLGRDVLDIAEGLWTFARAAAPVTGTILDIVAAVARMTSSLPPGMLSVVAGGTALAVTFGKIGTVVAGLSSTSKIARSGLSTLASTVGLIVPSRAYERLSGVRAKFDQWGDSAGRLTQKLGGSAAQGVKVASVTSTVGRVATGLGASLPLLGAALSGVAIAWDSVFMSASEAQDAMAQGGDAAAAAAEQLRAQGEAVDLVGQTWGKGYGQIADALTTDYDEQTKSLTGLALAQHLAGGAGDDFRKAVAAYGPTSAQAAAASRRYATATEKVATEQRAAAEGTDEHTAAIRNQQDALLENLNNEIGFRQAVSDANEALQNNGKGLDLNTQKGRDNSRALNQIVSSGKGWIKQLRDAHAPATQIAEAQKQTWKETYNAARAFGKSETAAAEYASKLLDIPQDIRTNIFADTKPGTIKLGAFVADIEDTNGVVTISGDPKPGDKVRSDFKLAIDSTRGTIRFYGNKEEGQKTLKDLVDRVNRSYGYTKIDASDGLARDEVRELKRWMSGQRGVLPVEVAIKPVTEDAIKGALGAALDRQFTTGFGFLPRKATGGPLVGPGTETSDSIPLWSNAVGPWLGSDGEHVITAKEVRGAGGHAVVARQRRLWRDAPRRAEGGPLGDTPTAAPVTAPAQGRSVAGVPVGAALANPGRAASGVAGLAAGVRDLTDKALVPLGAQLTKSTIPALQAIEDQAGKRTVAGVVRLATATAAQGRSMRATWATNATRVGGATRSMTGDVQRLQNRHGAAFRSMGAATASTVRGITGPQFGALRGGMSGIRSALGQTERVAATKFAAIFQDAAGPTRATLSGPFNQGIIRAFNTLSRQFNLGKPVPRVPIPFREGGVIRGPGTGTSDSIRAWTNTGDELRVSNGEFITREKQTSRFRRFLEALNNGEAEAEQAAGGAFARGPRGFAQGGIVADTGSAYNAQLQRGMTFAAKQSGKPYIWGGTGPVGFDCSGFQSAITASILGLPTTRRLFSTASFAAGPVAGFVNGLRSRFGLGVFQGSPGHMASTINGINAESGGSHGDVRFGPPAVGATHPQFVQHFSLPVVGGRFVGGGDSFDPGAVVRQAFSGVDKQIRSITGRWPGNTMAFDDAGVARRASNGIQKFSIDKLSQVMSTTSGAGAGQYQSYAQSQLAKYGWGPGQMPPLVSLWDKESGWNPGAINADSGAGGIPQALPPSKMGAGWRTNPTQQINWGLGYIHDRYGSPSAAWAHSQAVGWYDRGGLWKPGTFGFNGTGRVERVLEPRTTQNFERLTQVLDTRFGQRILRAGSDGAAAVPLVGSQVFQMPQGSTVSDVAREMRHQNLVLSKQVRR